MAVARKPNRVKPADAQISADTLKRWYADMLLIRRFEERAGQMYGMGLIGGFCHLYIGQEAVVVGMQASLDDGDTVGTAKEEVMGAGAEVERFLLLGDVVTIQLRVVRPGVRG